MRQSQLTFTVVADPTLIVRDIELVRRSSAAKALFLPAEPLMSDEVQRAHDDAIVRIRRTLERYG